MEHSNPTLAKIPILDTGKFEQWKFRIQQYLQNEHYALWEVIEFGDSYEASQDDAATGSAIVVTTEDMQKRRNDVKARTTLLVALPDEHQLRFSKYKTAQEFQEQQWEWEVNTASIPTASTQVSPASANVTAASISLYTACAYIASQSNGSQIKYWKKTGKKIFIQGTDVAGFDKSKDWSYMENEEENHALVANEEAPIEFTLMAKSSYDNEVEARLVEFKNQEIKFCKKIRGLEFKVESKSNRIECLTNELEMLKKEKERLDTKLTSFQSALKDLDNLIGSQRSNKNKEGLGYNAVPPPTQVYSPPKKDMSWPGLSEFADDTITDYTRPSPSIESNLNDFQNNSSSGSKNGGSTSSILSKPEICESS
nr:hypothetical protein [Tanacetum cinerariifolium]